MSEPPVGERLADLQARLALLHLSGMGPARSRWLLSRHAPMEVVSRLRSGELPAPPEEAPPGIRPSTVDRWRSEIPNLEPGRLLQDQVDQGWSILHPDDRAWPFGGEQDPPLLLFCAGDVDLLGARPAVAVVGTRRCTSVGRRVAHRMGMDLAEAGVAVVSGLALGIDAAAHKGVLDGGGIPVGVVGTGLDIVYPRGNQSLWHEVIDAGVLVSEYPAGTRPARWRFPARNRLIASLADATVIVESHGTGGALLTAEESAERGKPVLAVPGSVLSPAADGTNGLIADGAVPTRDASDVLVTLGWSGSAESTLLPGSPVVGEPSAEPIPVVLADDPAAVSMVAIIRREVQAGAISVDTLSVLTGAAPMTVLAVVRALIDAGEVTLNGSMVIGSHPTGLSG